MTDSFSRILCNNEKEWTRAITSGMENYKLYISQKKHSKEWYKMYPHIKTKQKKWERWKIIQPILYFWKEGIENRNQNLQYSGNFMKKVTEAGGLWGHQWWSF
jgi:hypothetical protein